MERKLIKYYCNLCDHEINDSNTGVVYDLENRLIKRKASWTENALLCIQCIRSIGDSYVNDSALNGGNLK